MRIKLIVWEKESGLKGSYIAEKIGISDSAWSKIKSGKQNPTLEQIEKLREVFGLENILDLLKEEETSNTSDNGVAIKR